jgi:VanZ family protein
MLSRGRNRLKTTPLSRAGIALRWALAVCWMGGIFYLSQQSSPLGASPSELESYLAHLCIYAVLAVLLYWAIWTAVAREDPELELIVATVAFGLTVLYGVSDELHQAFVPGRSASERDLAMDALGAVLGLAFALLAQQALSGIRRPDTSETP